MRDLKLLQADDYEELSLQTIEVKRMLTVLVQKPTLKAAMRAILVLLFKECWLSVTNGPIVLSLKGWDVDAI